MCGRAPRGTRGACASAIVDVSFARVRSDSRPVGPRGSVSVRARGRSVSGSARGRRATARVDRVVWESIVWTSTAVMTYWDERRAARVTAVLGNTLVDLVRRVDLGHDQPTCSTLDQDIEVCPQVTRLAGDTNF